MILLSFVIPAYNASSTIIRTLDSIYNQCLAPEEFEVIVVDDNSIDDTADMVDKYANIHKNLTLLRQAQNHRQGAARNKGIKAASGDYIMFVDADDIVESGIAKAITQSQIMQADVIFCNYLCIHSETEEELRHLPLEDGTIMSGREFCEHYFDMTINTCPISYLWNRNYLLKRKASFIEDRRMEDFDFIENNIFHATKVGYSTAIIYRVLTCFNTNSTTHQNTPETKSDWLHVAYRRIIFCNTIKNDSPIFCARIEKDSRRFVNHQLSFKQLIHYSPEEIKKTFSITGTDVLSGLAGIGGWSFFIGLCLKAPKVIPLIFQCEKTVAKWRRKIKSIIKT